MDIYQAGTRPSVRAREDWFTGTVWQDPVMLAPKPARVRLVRVAFEPGARTAWHWHPLGQTLHVTAGCGLVCTRGGSPRVIRPGDTVWIPPHEEHWHGAGPTTGMVHLAMQEELDGSMTEWLDKVSDEDYALPVA